MLCYFNVRCFKLKIFPNGSDVKHILMHRYWKLDGELTCSAILKSKGAKKIS
jgi:hypothetical protein